MSLRDYAAIARLGLALRSIWHNDPKITVEKIRKSFNLVWTFITGKEIDDDGVDTQGSEPAGSAAETEKDLVRSKRNHRRKTKRNL